MSNIIDTPNTHGMFMLGTETLFLCHMPMFGMEDHRYQVTLKARLNDQAMATYLADKAQHPGSAYNLINLDSDKFTLVQLATGQIPAFQAVVYRNYSNAGEGSPVEQIIASATVYVERIVYFRQFNVDIPRPQHLTYILFGEGAEAHLDHYIARDPDYQHLLTLPSAPHWLSPDQLETGVQVSFIELPSPEKPPCQNPLTEPLYQVMFQGLNDTELPLAVGPHTTVWFSTGNLLNAQDPCASAQDPTAGGPATPAPLTSGPHTPRPPSTRPGASMAQWNQFVTPGGQIDFREEPMKQQTLVQQWTTNLTGFINQGITGNPWQSSNASDQTWYFNPTTTDTSQGTYAVIPWSAFPARIQAYNPSMPMVQQLQLADTGYYFNNEIRQTFPAITTNLCPDGQPPSSPIPYGPYGPRGWQDEYCEWSVRRDPATNKITRIDFTCENPEYWNTLWMIDPHKVLELYRETLGKQQIQFNDLCLHDSNGQVVTDPSTGRPAYNPLNKWNSGPFSTDTQGGAMHLTSTPNTLQTEIGLAASATIPRTSGNSNATTLICCAQYGQIGRNSDPTIGKAVNNLTAPASGSPAMVTLANPPGLYIQMPDFTSYATPDNTPATTFWRIVRGNQTLTDPNENTFTDKNGTSSNFILHAVFEVPPGYGYSVSDITINGVNINWAGQVAQTFFMHIVGMAIPKTPVQANQPCVGSPTTPTPQPLQLFHAAVFNAMYNTSIPNPVQQPMNLASNSTLIAPLITVGRQNVPLVLVVAGLDVNGPTPTVYFGDGITAQVSGKPWSVNYTIPGNTYPSPSTAVPLLVSVNANAVTGLKGASVSLQGQSQVIPMPALLNVVGA